MIIDVTDLHLSGISFYVTRADGKKVDFSPLVTQFSWLDHVNVAAVEVGLSLEGTPADMNQVGMEGSTASIMATLPDVTTGGLVRRLIWSGFFEEVVDDHGAEGVDREITAYDAGKFLAGHEEDYVFRGSTLSQIVSRVAADLSLPVGVIPSTGRSLGDMVCRGEAMWDLFQKAVQKHRDLTGEFYRILFRDGRLHLELQGSNTSWWIFEVGRSLQQARRTRTIADLENRLKIYGNIADDLAKAKVESTIENAQSQAVYGLRQRVEYVASAEDRKKVQDVSKKRIERNAIPSETIEITGWAVPLLRAGERIEARDIELGVSGMYFVESIDCTWVEDGATSVATCRRAPIDPGLFLDDLVVA